MSLPREKQVEFILPKYPHALAGRSWFPVPPTEVKFYGIHSLWQYPGPLDVERLKSTLALTLSDYPLWAGRLARHPIKDGAFGDDVSESGWRIELDNTAGVQFSSVSTRHPGIFRPGYQDNDLHRDFYEGFEIPSVNLHGIHPDPLMKVKLTHWELTGETSITTTFCHTLGDAATAMRLMESWSNYYQGLAATWTPSFEKYLTPSPITAKALPLDYISLTSPYIGFIAVHHSLDSVLNGLGRLYESSVRIDLKFPSNTLRKVSEMVLKTSQECNRSKKPSATDSLGAYLVYILQKVSDTKIVQAQQLFGYRGMKLPPNNTEGYGPPPTTSAGNCFMMVSSKERLDGTESVGKIASILRGTIEELRHPELFQKTFAVYSHLCKRSVDTWRFPMELPTDIAVMVNTISKLPALKCHFGYPDRVRMYHWDSYLNFFEIVPANPVKTPSGEWITYPEGVDVFVRIRKDLVVKYLKTLADDMRIHGFGEVMTAIGGTLQDSSKL
ncbi:hypothetical protein BJ912DRAFT_549261 [Pholiota molesta]|nr:hypothetical protein BJ912DRAFT_549261 [Pholiota molesta]